MAKDGHFNRDGMEIMGDILRLSMEGMSKTRIGHAANLSYEQASRYLSELQAAGLIEGTRNRIYRATRKGRLFLEAYGEMKLMIYGKNLPTSHRWHSSVKRELSALPKEL